MGGWNTWGYADHTRLDFRNRQTLFRFRRREHTGLIQRSLWVNRKTDYPLRIYTGFSESIIPEHFVLKAGVFRQYNQEIKEFDLDKNYEQIANEIVSGEFPKVMHCNEQSLAIILDFKIPGLVFFERSNFNSTEREAVQQSVKNQSDYLLLLNFDFDKTDKCNFFMKNFLDAKNAPSLKILNLLKGV